MTNSRYGRGLILAITTPKSSLTNEDKEIYEIISESRGTKYTVNFEDGTCTCADFVNRGEICKHFYKIVMERAIC
jgi:hypothetical protein